MKAIAIAICLALLVNPEMGQATKSSALTPASSIGVAGEPGAPNSFRPKSPGKATRLSTFATLAPLCLGLQLTKNDGLASSVGGTMAVAGVLFGPSVGYFYGGCGRRGMTGIAVRVGFSALGAIAATQAEWPNLISLSGDSGEPNAAAQLTAVAFTLVFVDMVLDIVQVSRAVRRQNVLRARQAPMATPLFQAPFGSQRPAVGLRIRF